VTEEDVIAGGAELAPRANIGKLSNCSLSPSEEKTGDRSGCSRHNSHDPLSQAFCTEVFPLEAR
jgi:hypothetical protein